MVHFADSSSNKKPTLTILDKEDDLIAEGVAVRVDKPMLTPFETLLDNRLTDSCYSVEFTSDIQSLDGIITSMRILKVGSPLFAASIPSQEAVPLLRHHILNWTLSSSNFSPCFSDSFFTPCYGDWLDDILGRNKERLVKWRLYNGLYASLFSYDMSVNVFEAFYK